MDFYVLITWIKNGPLEAFLGQFRRFGGHEVPFLRCFGQIRPRNAIWGVPGRLLGLLRFFLLCRSSIQGVSHFLPQAGGFYVGLRGCFQERLLCVFTWVTLSPSANTGRHVRPKTGFNKAVFYTGLGLMCAARIKI